MLRLDELRDLWGDVVTARRCSEVGCPWGALPDSEPAACELHDELASRRPAHVDDQVDDQVDDRASCALLLAGAALVVALAALACAVLL